MLLVQFSLLASFFLRQLLAASFLNYSWLTLLYRVKVPNQLELMPIVQKSTELNYIYTNRVYASLLSNVENVNKQLSNMGGKNRPHRGSNLQCQKFTSSTHKIEGNTLWGQNSNLKLFIHDVRASGQLDVVQKFCSKVHHLLRTTLNGGVGQSSTKIILTKVYR